MRGPRSTSVVARIRELCAEPGPERALRAAILEALRVAVPFDYYVWVGTDPVTAVGTAPLAEVPSLADLPRLIRLKYATTVNRWTSIPTGVATTLVDTTGDDLTQSLLWRDLLHHYGVCDIASTVLRDRFGCWAFLDLYRTGGSPFSSAERDVVASILADVTAALRRATAATFVSQGRQMPSTGPAVLLLDNELAPRTQTPPTEARLRALLPTEPAHAPVPAVAFNVAAQLLALETGVDDHPPSARVHQGDGHWVSVRAARLTQTTPADPAIAVTVEATTTVERAEIFCRASGLTARETQVVEYLVTGTDTRATARTLGIAETTVTDHLKSIFTKCGVSSRAQVVALIAG